jgi:hypothetical protein
MILKIFSPKNSAKKLAFLTQNKGKLCKILIITLVFEKSAIFSQKIGENRLKILIITSTPGLRFLSTVALFPLQMWSFEKQSHEFRYDLDLLHDAPETDGTNVIILKFW